MSMGGSYRLLRAGAAMFTTVVGVGVFALPYVFAQAGFLVGLTELVVLAGFELLLLLMYAEITVQTPGRQRFGGYVGHYLGVPGRLIGSTAVIVSMFGSLLAFTILGGQFLSALSGWSPEVSTACLVLGVALMTFGGLKEISRLSVYAMALVVALYGVLIAFTLPVLQLPHVLTVSTQPSQMLLPYGVIIFALAGLGAIPEMHDILERQFHRLPRVVMVSYGAIVGLYALFALAVVGATGAATTPDAISGLANIVPPALLVLGTVLGLVSVVSIQSMVQVEFSEALSIDARVPKIVAWLIAALGPFLVYLAGVREFIGVMGFVGSVLAGVMGLLVVITYERMKRTKTCKQKKCFRIPTWLSLVVAAVFLFGLLIGI